jgi:hypothetical protein
MRRVEAPILTQFRPLAQLVEQLAFNQFVEGSNPSRPTTLKVLKDFMESLKTEQLY